jgi:PEP-CTERM motif
MMNVNRPRRVGIALALALAPVASPVSATHFRYMTTDWSRGASTSVRFLLPHLPDAVDPLGPQYLGIAGILDGAPTTFQAVTLLTSGGVAFTDVTGTTFAIAGPAVFTGPATDPVFAPLRGSLGSGTPTGRFAVAEVPEPSSWALLLIGFGLMGVALRNRKAVGA